MRSSNPPHAAPKFTHARSKSCMPAELSPFLTFIGEGVRIAAFINCKRGTAYAYLLRRSSSFVNGDLRDEARQRPRTPISDPVFQISR